jgi:hypothetical protein
MSGIAALARGLRNNEKGNQNSKQFLMKLAKGMSWAGGDTFRCGLQLPSALQRSSCAW